MDGGEMDNPEPTEPEQEQADTGRQEDEEAMRYPGHEDPPRPDAAEDE
jgi:hypothetical protein